MKLRNILGLCGLAVVTIAAFSTTLFAASATNSSFLSQETMLSNLATPVIPVMRLPRFTILNASSSIALVPVGPFGSSTGTAVPHLYGAVIFKVEAPLDEDLYMQKSLNLMLHRIDENFNNGTNNTYVKLEPTQTLSSQVIEIPYNNGEDYYQEDTYVIKAGTTANFIYTEKLPVSELFQGVYEFTVLEQQFAYHKDGQPYRINIMGNRSSNQTFVGGETSPYILNGNPIDENGNVTLSVIRLYPFQSTLVIDNKNVAYSRVSLSGTSSATTTIKFNANTLGYGPGYHNVQIKDSLFGNSNTQFFHVPSVNDFTVFDYPQDGQYLNYGAPHRYMFKAHTSLGDANVFNYYFSQLQHGGTAFSVSTGRNGEYVLSPGDEFYADIIRKPLYVQAQGCIVSATTSVCSNATDITINFLPASTSSGATKVQTETNSTTENTKEAPSVKKSLGASIWGAFMDLVTK